VADVELSIFNDDGFIYLEGITVREPRPGGITLEIPPLEAWEERLRWLLPEQRERVETPESFGSSSSTSIAAIWPRRTAKSGDWPVFRTKEVRYAGTRRPKTRACPLLLRLCSSPGKDTLLTSIPPEATVELGGEEKGEQHPPARVCVAPPPGGQCVR
jgi:hypothetical protein